MALGDPDSRSLLEGLYEQLLTERVQARLQRAADLEADLEVVTGAIDEADEPEVLARFVRDAVWRALSQERDSHRRRDLANRLLVHLDPDHDVIADSRQLLAVLARPGPGAVVRHLSRPSTPLAEAALLTNAQGEPSVGAELRCELPSADRVDVVLAFVRWHGLRLLERELRGLRERGVPLRLVTTTYLGATERQALDRLVTEFGAQVKVQFDALRTRLHAKAWLFHRRTGYDTAYVGSSNLSRAALLDGVEWNVRLSAVATPSLLDKFRATFETYWNDPTFESYDPVRDRDRLDDALAEARGARAHDRITLSLSGLDVRPYAYQADILERLEVERIVHDRHRNLVVAATGTGKTVIAALDYRGIARSWGRRPSLLFVAHRKEILEQSLRTYREVLGTPDFGELYVGGARPERWRHVFASVQSLTAYGVESVPSEAFEIVVIDEFHHAEARTYRRLLEHLNPRELLGLTATPERGDGGDVRDFFDGRTAAELRLWDALKAELLTPFHYFGVADGIDLRRVDWKAGSYDTTALSILLTGNDVRARAVLAAVRDKIADLDAMRALGFCVSREHATYMARVFLNAGIPATTVLGTTPAGERTRALDDLRNGRIKAVFTVDVFNEGLDLPTINTVLFLRPTESATVFVQQLGRGLRRAPDKAVLTALDFVGHHRKEFRFDLRYRALTGTTKRQLARDIEHGFPFLPPGTQIVLDRQSQHLVLENIQSQVTSSVRGMVTELRTHPTDSLAAFLDESGVELSDVVRSDRSWTRLRREAGLSTPGGGPREVTLLKRVRALAHVDDPARAQAYLRWLDDDTPAYPDAAPGDQAYARMLFFSLWPDGGGFSSFVEAFDALRAERSAREDLSAVIRISVDRAEHISASLTGDLRQRPLRVHARYTREEIVAALDHVSLDGRKPNSIREGVMFSPPSRSDAFFITLHKSEADYSPTTMYRDYAVSPELFHWESQSATTIASPTGQRYLHHRDHGTHILLFARPTKTTEFGSGAPYLFLGEADYLSHEGERPIAITWRLRTPMPVSVFEASKVVA